MPGRVLKHVERGLGHIHARGQVFALPGVVAVAEVGHTLERLAAQGVGVAEVVFSGHVVAHPISGGVELRIEREGAQAVGLAMTVDQGQEGLLFRIEGGLCAPWRRCYTDQRHDEGQQRCED